MTRCLEYVPAWPLAGSRVLVSWRCPYDGDPCTLETPPGRPTVSRSYCQEHGGHERARAEAVADWDYAAPASVGDQHAVQLAGTMGLSSEHVYVVVRPERGVWLAFLGIGSHMTAVERPDYRGCGKRGCKACPAGPPYCGRRRCSFATMEEAQRAGIEAWLRGLNERIAEIRKARGGTLDWGAPIHPREQPIVIVQDRPGDTWDAAAVAHASETR